MPYTPIPKSTPSLQGMYTNRNALRTLDVQLASIFPDSAADLCSDLAYLIDELLQLHNKLDELNIPDTVGPNQWPLDLSVRIQALHDDLAREIDLLETRLAALPDLAAFADEIDAKCRLLTSLQHPSP